MLQRLKVSCFLCLVTWILNPGSLAATVVLPADFRTIVSESVVIVHGRVVSVRSAMSSSPRTIESVVTLAVLEPLKGDAGAMVSFRVPYGEVGRYRRVIVGAPEFVEGEQVIVFLHGRPPAMPTVFGLNQGVYRVSSGEAGRLMVMPPIRAEASARIVRGDPARVPIPIAAFAREVRDVAEGSR